jgi:predicted metal-dependent HD superfamily phosphohydrolase
MQTRTNLIQAWQSLTQILALGNADVAGRHLIDCYSESHRHFHTTEHLSQVLRHLDSVSAGPLLLLAAWFHDAIYEPGAYDNEERSALLATRTLVDLGLPDEAVRFVAEAIRATASHRHDREDFTLLLDADMSILGSAPPVYTAYRQDIRNEYRAIQDAAFRLGRKAFAAELLSRPAIFKSPWFNERFEAPARRNLLDELNAGEGS